VAILVPAVLGGMAILVMVVMSSVQQRRNRRAAAGPQYGARSRILIHSINDDRCTGCDACVAVCPTNVLDLLSNKSRVVRFQDCIQCEACMWACPTEALVMHPEGTSAPALTVPELDANYQTAVPGQYLIGEVAGKPLIKNAANIGRGVVEHMLYSGLREQMRRRAEGSDASDVTYVDVAIVGSGPGGLSAALTCAQRGLSYVILEKEQIVASTIARYPKGKLVMAEPYDCRNVSLLPVFDSSKEQIVPMWEDLIARVGLNIKRGETVEAVQRRADGNFDVRTTVAAYRSQRVVLSTGLRGKPRTLGVPGENLPTIHSLLEDPDAWGGSTVTVVGGGDSALEAAMSLADAGAKVLLSYRGGSFARAQAKNKQAISSYAAQRRIKIKFQTQVAEFSTAGVTLRFHDGAHKRYPCDAAFVLIGADPPVKWLEKLGVRFVQRPHTYQLGPTDGFVHQFVRDAIDCPDNAADAEALIRGEDPRDVAARATSRAPRSARTPVPKILESGRKFIQSASAIFTSARRLDKPMPLSEFAARSRRHAGHGRRDALADSERTRVLRMLRDDGARLADEDSQVYEIQDHSGLELGWDKSSPAPSWDESSPFAKDSAPPLHLNPDELALAPETNAGPIGAPREAVIVGLAKAQGARRRKTNGSSNGTATGRGSAFHAAPTVEIQSPEAIDALLAESRSSGGGGRRARSEDPTAYQGRAAPPRPGENMAVSLQRGVDERSESMELQDYRPVNEGPRGRRPPPGLARAQRLRGGPAVDSEVFEEATRAVDFDPNVLMAAATPPGGNPVTSISSVVIDDDATELVDMSHLPDIPPPRAPRFRSVKTMSDVDFDFDD
jgi:thioredoxin reductase/NAD-dependent dihydropyrimidine dehydrogenase PreA subunit